MATLEESGYSSLPQSLTRMQQPETAKNIYVFLNGDQYFSGRKFVINRKHISNFDGFLNQVTAGMKAPFGAIRNVYTPQYGHRVNELEQLKSGMKLVAGGVERFRKLEYNEIANRKRPQPRRNYLDIKLHPTRMNVSARWRKYVKDPCQIYVYGNGDINAPAMRLLLIPRCMKTWDLVLGEVTEKISLRTGQAVRKLYDMNFRLLRDPSQLESGQYYVAVGTERLKKYPYGELHKVHVHSPRRSNHQTLPPIKKGSKSKTQEGSYTTLFAQKKQQKEQQEETTVMGASAATGYRPLKTKTYQPQKPSEPPTHEGESVFHAKPVKVKRASGREVAAPYDVHPPSEENDGVFRTNSGHIKAEEVAEDEDTKLDLPIDQIPADEVEEEQLPSTQKMSDDDASEHQKSTAGGDEGVEPTITLAEEETRKQSTDGDQHPDSSKDAGTDEIVAAADEEAPEKDVEDAPNVSEPQLTTDEQNQDFNSVAPKSPSAEKIAEEVENESNRASKTSSSLKESSSIKEAIDVEDTKVNIQDEEMLDDLEDSLKESAEVDLRKGEEINVVDGQPQVASGPFVHQTSSGSNEMVDPSFDPPSDEIDKISNNFEKAPVLHGDEEEGEEENRNSSVTNSVEENRRHQRSVTPLSPDVKEEEQIFETEEKPAEEPTEKDTTYPVPSPAKVERDDTLKHDEFEKDNTGESISSPISDNSKEETLSLSEPTEEDAKSKSLKMSNSSVDEHQAAVSPPPNNELNALRVEA